MTPSEMTRLHEAAQTVRGLGGPVPRVGIVLGTGLGGLAGAIDVQASIAYADLPHFPVSTVESHEGGGGGGAGCCSARSKASPSWPCRAGFIATRGTR